jgi:hypothetical protein
MSPPDTNTFEVLRAADPDVMDAEQLDELTAAIAAHRAWCDALQIRITRRQRALAAEGRAADPRNSLSRHGRHSSKDANTAAEREQVCTAMPGFEDALASGSVAAGHLDAISQASRNLDEPTLAEFHASQHDLLADASRQSVDTFGRTCRDLARAISAHHHTNDTAAEELEAQRNASNTKTWTDQATGITLIDGVHATTTCEPTPASHYRSPPSDGWHVTPTSSRSC